MLWERARNIENDVAALISHWFAYEYDGSTEYGMQDIAYGGSVFYALYFHGNMVRDWFNFALVKLP